MLLNILEDEVLENIFLYLASSQVNLEFDELKTIKSIVDSEKDQFRKELEKAKKEFADKNLSEKNIERKDELIEEFIDSFTLGYFSAAIYNYNKEFRKRVDKLDSFNDIRILENEFSDNEG